MRRPSLSTRVRPKDCAISIRKVQAPTDNPQEDACVEQKPRVKRARRYTGIPFLGAFRERLPCLTRVVLSRVAPILLLSLAVPALANMASPAITGDTMRELGGGVRDLFIEKERLTFDLRPLGARDGRRDIQVEAVYRVRNDKEARKVELFFVAGSAPGAASVTLDGDSVPFERVSIPDSDLPVAWRPPTATPPLLMSMPIPYRTRSLGDHLRFSVDLSTGTHELRVAYAAEPGRYATNSPTVMWQFGYVLSPAKEWAGFGNIDIRVLLPPGWKAVAEPELKKKGDVLSDTWKYLPADVIALTAQAPPPDLLESQWLALLLGPVILILVSSRLGMRHRKTGTRLVRFVPWALLAGFLLALLVIGSIQFDHSRLERAAPGQISWAYTYSNTLLSIFFGVFVFVFGAALAQTSAWFSSRRAERAPG